METGGLMRLLVTGGCGFIGSAFIRQCLSDPSRQISHLINVDALTYAGDPARVSDVAGDPRYQFVHGDIGDESLISDLLADECIDHVVHFAAETHVDRSIDGPGAFVRTNVAGLVALLEATRRYWSACSAQTRAQFRFLNVSSDEVFGSLALSQAPVREGHTFAPNSPYAASKAAGDHFVRSFGMTYGLSVLTTNGSNTYGPGQYPEKLIPLAITRALEGQSIPVYGDGMHVRDWLHVDDHAEAIWRVLMHGKAGTAYNVAGGNERHNIEVVRQLCSALDKRARRADGRSYSEQIAFVGDRQGHDRRYALDCDRICRELEWRPIRNFDRSLDELVAWHVARAQRTVAGMA